jgi:hypothetical protein
VALASFESIPKKLSQLAHNQKKIGAHTDPACAWQLCLSQALQRPLLQPHAETASRLLFQPTNQRINQLTDQPTNQPTN